METSGFHLSQNCIHDNEQFSAAKYVQEESKLANEVTHSMNPSYTF